MTEGHSEIQGHCIMGTDPVELFIGRFQPCHNAHLWLFDQQLSKGKKIWIAIRDMAPDERNPLTSFQSYDLLSTHFEGNPNVFVSIVPNITSVNYGRGVGYDINEFSPPEDIKTISATRIRQYIRDGKPDWKQYVPASVHQKVEMYLK